MASLFFDEDLRRIYEVPTDPQFTVDGSGYRIYTPASAPEAVVRFSSTYVWSQWVDFHNTNKWSTLALEKGGGQFRYQTAQGADVFATFDLRLINDWLFVPANYRHDFFIDGNLFPNANTGLDADYDRITAPGVSFRINFADSLQVIRETVISGSGLSVDQEAALFQARDHARAANAQTQS